MDISTDRRRSEATAESSRSVILNAVRRMLRWLGECFRFTEADRKKAGIYIRRNGA
ncbi:MAG: hypothetical protein JW748_13625 [Anaerolineales bacterium]|nr:hypothetical protein [Anaerolineales bacterium]